jgi:hypothetical protein
MDLSGRGLCRVAAYSRPENKVSLGFVEGFNNEIHCQNPVQSRRHEYP